MKHTYLVLFVLLVSGAWAQIPDWAWARPASSAGDDAITALAADASGNVYATGYFSGSSVTFGSTTLNNSGTARQFFLVKYTRTGAVLWAKSAGGNDDDIGTAVALDGSGNVYVSGNFESSAINFGGSSISNSSNPGLSDVFLAKFSSAGTHLWSSGYGSALQEEANDIDVDAAGNVAMTGNYFSLSVLFGGFGVINSGVSDAFLTKFSSAGVPQWAKRIGGGQTDNGNGVGFDASGNIYVVGDFNSTTLPTYSPALTNAGGFDVFVAKYNSAGNSTMAYRFGGTGDEAATTLLSQGSGDFFIAGTFESNSLVFGSTTLAKTGTRSMYLVKYNNTGQAQWAQKAAASQNSAPEDLAEGGNGIFMTGSYDLSSLVFGSTTLSNGGSQDGFVVHHDKGSGNVLWAKTTGSSSLEQSLAVAVGGGFAHLGGLFTSTLVLRDITLSATGSTDGFLTKLCLPPANPVSVSGGSACPGAQVSLNATVPAGSSAVWFSSATGGTTVHAGSNFSAIAGSTFYVAARDTNAGCAMYSLSRLAASGAVHPAVNATVGVAGHTLIASGNGTVSAWLDCEHHTVLPGATGNNYVISSSGHYAVVMTSPQGCRDTSACNHYSYTPGTSTIVVTTDVSRMTKEPLAITVFPNPSTGVFFARSSVNVSCALVNALGQTVQRVTLDDQNNRTVQLGPVAPGVYFLIPENNRQALRRVLVSP